MHFAAGLFTGIQFSIGSQAMQISSENLSRCQNYATKVAQFIKKITLVICIYSQS